MKINIKSTLPIKITINNLVQMWCNFMNFIKISLTQNKLKHLTFGNKGSISTQWESYDVEIAAIALIKKDGINKYKEPGIFIKKQHAQGEPTRGV